MTARIGVDDIGSACEFVIALSKKDGWIYTDTPIAIDQPDWDSIPGLPANANNLRFAGRVPILVKDQWISAGLLNEVDASGEAAAIYRDPDDGGIAVKTWANRYPAGLSNEPLEGTPDSMPRASISANWGDYVFLGDIQWKRDRSISYSQANSIRYPHGIWRSDPGTTDKWHPDETFFVGQKLEANAILGMFPMDPGLLVVTQSQIALLRGEPNDFAFEELRSGVSPESRYEVTFWPYAGVVAWLDRFGRVWVTNGDTVERLDRGVDIQRTGPGCLLAVDENLFVSGRADVRVFHSFGETGAWTTLQTPSGWSQATFCRQTVVGVGADQIGRGNFVLDSDEFGRLDVNTLQSEPDTVQVFSLTDEDRRGTFNGVPVKPKIVSRPLPGASNRTIFWHRFGIRANGPGKLRTATSYPGPDTSKRGLVERVFGFLSRRKDWTFRAHGPSIEATFEFEFEGDVSPEHMTVAAASGKAEK